MSEGMERVTAQLQVGLVASQKIADLISEFSLGEYELASWETKNAVEDEYQVLAGALEEVRNLDLEFAERIPGLAEAVGVGHHISGAELEAEDEIIWRSAAEELPQLQQALLQLLMHS